MISTFDDRVSCSGEYLIPSLNRTDDGTVGKIQICNFLSAYRFLLADLILSRFSTGVPHLRHGDHAATSQFPQDGTHGDSTWIDGFSDCCLLENRQELILLGPDEDSPNSQFVDEQGVGQVLCISVF